MKKVATLLVNAALLFGFGAATVHAQHGPFMLTFSGLSNPARSIYKPARPRLNTISPAPVRWAHSHFTESKPVLCRPAFARA
jgi:hypothetical protein